MADRTPNQQRLDALQKRLDERGSELRGVCWAPGAENLPAEERRKALADMLEPFLNGKGTPVYCLHDDLLSGEQLVERAHALEDSLRELVGILRGYGTFPPNILPALANAEAALGVSASDRQAESQKDADGRK